MKEKNTEEGGRFTRRTNVVERREATTLKTQKIVAVLLAIFFAAIAVFLLFLSM